MIVWYLKCVGEASIYRNNIYNTKNDNSHMTGDEYIFNVATATEAVATDDNYDDNRNIKIQ